MPELPEVETTVRYLAKKLVGLKFRDVWTDWTKTFKKAGGFEKFKKAIRNRKILSVRRRAKFIVIDIEGKYSIFIHQKISGHLLYGKWKNEGDKWIPVTRGPIKDDPENRFIRTMWSLSNGYQLAFADLRRFGKVILVEDNDVSNLPEIKKLGPEPLDIKIGDFINLFKNKRGRIKQVLMDPFFIVGIGNIYADEILWSSGIHPLSRVEKLPKKDLKKIFDTMNKILNKAIKLGGSSVDDYRMPSGDMGGYQDQTRAYQHHGEECAKKDGGTIERIKLGGRSTHFCAKHQKLV